MMAQDGTMHHAIQDETGRVDIVQCLQQWHHAGDHGECRPVAWQPATSVLSVLWKLGKDRLPAAATAALE